MNKLKDFIDYLFPNEVSKVIAGIIIVIVILISIVFTFIIVRHAHKSNLGENNKEGIEIISNKNLELIEPNFSFQTNIDTNLFLNSSNKIEEKDYYEIFKYHEFQDFTEYFFDINYYKKSLRKFLND